MKACRIAISLVISGLVLYAIPALANPVVMKLFNTGVANNGTLLAEGVVDPHYTLTQSADDTNIGPEVFTLADSTVYPFDLWTTNTTVSQWSSPNPDNYTQYLAGYYTYRTTFHLPGSFDPSTDVAFITGFWSTDNDGIDIRLNDVSTGNSIPFDLGIPNSYSWSYLSPLSITSGFTGGTNTIDFVIFNGIPGLPPGSTGGGPTGIQVQMTGTYDLHPIPEPSTLALLGIGILGLIGYGWRRGRRR